MILFPPTEIIIQQLKNVNTIFYYFSTFSTSAIPEPTKVGLRHELQLPETVRSSYRNAEKLLRSANKGAPQGTRTVAVIQTVGEDLQYQNQPRRTIRKSHTAPIAANGLQMGGSPPAYTKGKAGQPPAESKKNPAEAG